jgi:hypothetical protein
VRSLGRKTFYIAEISLPCAFSILATKVSIRRVDAEIDVGVAELGFHLFRLNAFELRNQAFQADTGIT